MSELIRAEGLTHIYGEKTPFVKTAIEDMSFTVGRGEFIGVIGHTGSGKSTLMQHLNGLLRPTSGKLFFDGKDIWQKGYSLRGLRFKVGLVFQYPEYQLFEDTVEKDIGYGPKNMGLSEDEIRERVYRAADIVGLRRNELDKSPFDLSGGQKRRAAIAGIMAMEPQVLVLDEPTAGLDPGGRDEILSRIREYRERTGCTVLLVSHSMETVAGYAEKVMVIDKSRLAIFDETDKVFSQYKRLTEMGLDVPQMTRIFIELRRRGYDVSSSVYTAESAVKEIIRKLND